LNNEKRQLFSVQLDSSMGSTELLEKKFFVHVFLVFRHFLSMEIPLVRKCGIFEWIYNIFILFI
jgi:hypothetical protein